MVLLIEFDRVKMHFLMAGHTNNRCDAASGLVKHQLMKRSVLTPADMFKAINESSASTHTVCSTNVRFLRWKDIQAGRVVYAYRGDTDCQATNFFVFFGFAGSRASLAAKLLQGGKDIPNLQTRRHLWWSVWADACCARYGSFCCKAGVAWGDSISKGKRSVRLAHC